MLLSFSPSFIPWFFHTSLDFSHFLPRTAYSFITHHLFTPPIFFSYSLLIPSINLVLVIQLLPMQSLLTHSLFLLSCSSHTPSHTHSLTTLYPLYPYSFINPLSLVYSSFPAPLTQLHTYLHATLSFQYTLNSFVAHHSLLLPWSFTYTLTPLPFLHLPLRHPHILIHSLFPSPKPTDGDHDSSGWGAVWAVCVGPIWPAHPAPELPLRRHGESLPHLRHADPPGEWPKNTLLATNLHTHFFTVQWIVTIF